MLARIASTRSAMLAIARPMYATMSPKPSGTPGTSTDPQMLFAQQSTADTDEGRLNEIVRAVLDKIAEQHATPDTLLDQARADVAENEAFLRRTG